MSGQLHDLPLYPRGYSTQLPVENEAGLSPETVRSHRRKMPVPCRESVHDCSVVESAAETTPTTVPRVCRVNMNDELGSM